MSQLDIEQPLDWRNHFVTAGQVDDAVKAVALELSEQLAQISVNQAQLASMVQSTGIPGNAEYVLRLLSYRVIDRSQARALLNIDELLKGVGYVPNKKVEELLESPALDDSSFVDGQESYSGLSKVEQETSAAESTSGHAES